MEKEFSDQKSNQLSQTSKVILLVWALVLCAMFLYVPVSTMNFAGGNLVMVQEIYQYTLIYDQPNPEGARIFLINYQVIFLQVAGWSALMLSIFYFTKK